ncbi:hypothetical protein V8E54_002530 [Elaphomyces granulatus]
MKASIISTIIATLLAASSAVQFPVSTHCQLEIPATFTAPDGVTSFTQTFPADNQWYPIQKFLPVSYISISQEGAVCVFFGAIDGGLTAVFDPSQTATVRNPQPQASGFDFEVPLKWLHLKEEQDQKGVAIPTE